MNATYPAKEIKYGAKAIVQKRNEMGAWETIHRGRVVGLTTTHAKVHDFETKVNPEHAELFPFESKCVRVRAI
jgi:hypothetical protein